MAPRIIKSCDETAFRELAKELDLPISGFDTCLSTWDGDDLLGGVIYQKATKISLVMHVAGFTPNWLNRDFLWVAFAYPFLQLGMERIFGQVRSDNERALTFDLKLGFRIVTTIPKVYEGADQIILGMERDDCRHLKIKPRFLSLNRVH